MSIAVKHLHRFGPFKLDEEQRLIRRDDVKIPLPPKAFDLLLFMVKNPLRLLTKEELLRAIWPDSFVEEGNLSQNIFLLRKALTTEKSDSRYIVTIPGRGYQFASQVEIVSQMPQDEMSPGGDGDMVLSSVRSTVHIVVHEEIDDTAPPRVSTERGQIRGQLAPPPTPSRRLQYAAAGLLLFGIGAGSYLWWRDHRPHLSSQKIVLADFENRTGDPAFDVVLKKALEIGLGQSPYLDVMSEQQAVSMLQLMGRKEDAPFTRDVATEICQRSNRQVMLQGSIANLGSDYLLTLQATDCLSGKRLAEAKAEAAGKEKVLAALDQAADTLRHDLGESGQSVERFEVPIAQATTSSLEALKAYSIGEYMVGRTGKEETETLPIFQRAVELDPQFAMAYAAIATDYYNLNEFNEAKPYYQKAFDLSTHVSEKEKLYIRAHYYADDLKDLTQGIKQYQLWAETYPRDWGPWLNIANAYTLLGQYAPAIAAAEHALTLDSSRGIIYSVLARAYMRVNRFADAKSTAQRSVALHKDSYGLHATLFQIASVEQDEAAMQREIAWSQGRPSEWFSLHIQAFAAATSGKYKQSEALFRAAHDLAQRENLAETSDDVLIDQAIMELEMGQTSAARETLKRVKQPATENPDFVFLNAQLGSLPVAERFLAARTASSHLDTLMNYVYLPRLRAEIALQDGKPLDALAALEPAAPYELAVGLTVLTQRGEAYMRAGQIDKAAAEYRKVLDHQGVDPVSPLFPLAHLQLARAEAQNHHPAESRVEYERLFSLWKDADKDLPLLVTARREYAELNTRR